MTVCLNELDVFAPEKAPDLVVHPEFDRFVARVPKDRLLELVSWAPPLIAMNRRTGRARVYGNQLTTGLARQLFPERDVLAIRYRVPPPRQLSFGEVASLVLFVFGAFVDCNADLVCRLSGTAAEAALLIGKSINTAAVTRERLGVLTP